MPTRRSRLGSLASTVCASASLLLGPSASWAGPGPESPVEGPARPATERPLDSAPDSAPDSGTDSTPDSAPESPLAPTIEPPPPSLDPSTQPGIEFKIPSPNQAAEAKPEREPPLAMSFPDPGVAPNDGAAMLVLGGTTLGLTLAGFGVGLSYGLRNHVPLEWLLPSTLIPTVGLLAFAGGGLGLGIQRARAHHRWELANRVIGTPQGGGLNVGASFLLLAALGLIPSGAFALQRGDTALGATSIALGSISAVVTPIMFSLGAKRQRDYARTRGWYRRPIPQLRGEARLQLAPQIGPLPGGAALGVAGRF